jgi:intracellular sulfur oxidation DsrE/DsrF family protein
MNRTIKIALILATMLFAAGARAAPLNDAQALQGQHEAKAIFMIDLNNPGKLAHVLKVVEETDIGLARQGATPHLIAVVIGPAVAFLTKDRRGISYMEQPAVAHIQSEVKKLVHMGIRFEACGVALKGMDIQPSDVITAVHPVGTGYISAIGYQAQGYQLVPIY